MKTYDELVIGLHRPPKTNRSHSFHATSSKHLYSSENNVVISSAEEDSDHEVGMDCERDSLNPSLKDASSLQGYIYIRITLIPVFIVEIGGGFESELNMVVKDFLHD